jgi:hypothetical protein
MAKRKTKKPKKATTLSAVAAAGTLDALPTGPGNVDQTGTPAPSAAPAGVQHHLRLLAELILKILEPFIAAGDFRTIRNIAFLSKQFYRLAAPQLVPRDLIVREIPKTFSDDALNMWLAPFNGVTTYRLENARSLVLRNFSKTFLFGRVQRLYDSALLACCNIETLVLDATEGVEPKWSVLSGLTT